MLTTVFHRHLMERPALATTASGVHIVDQAGKKYIDASGGAAVSCLGHAHPEVIEAMRKQLEQLPYAHTGFFTSEVAEQLADELIRTASERSAPFKRVYFVSGGSEAIEAALKMARQYFVEKGQPNRRKFIARRQSYHGNTLGALAVGGNKWRRRQFEPLLIDVAHVSPCYAYRDKKPGETDTEYGARLANELEQTILQEGPESVIAFVAETVGGATSGVIPAVAGYFSAIRKVCDRYGVLLILDEVMCGMGRTGTLHAWEQEGVTPDLQAIAKGLGGGYQPIGAVLVSGEIVDTIQSGTGFFHHGHTYVGHPMGCAAALAVQRVIERDKLLDKVFEQGKILGEMLNESLGKKNYIGDIRGRGFFWAVELVKNTETKETFDPGLKLHARIKNMAMQNGLACYPSGGTIDGISGDHVMLAPPFIATDDDLAEIVSRLTISISAAIDSC